MSCHLSYSEGGGGLEKGFDSFFQALREAGGMLLKLSRQSCNVDFFFFTPLFFLPPFPSTDSVIYDGRALEHPLKNDEGGNMILIIMK